MSTRNPYPVQGNRGQNSHKRFPKKAKATDIRATKAAAKVVKAMKAIPDAGPLTESVEMEIA
jgi:hypothetical protein